MVRIDTLEQLKAFWQLYCPECREKLHPIGTNMNPFWCSKCKKSYWLELRDAKMTEEDLKNVIGFPKTQRVQK
jgi:tRNA(Ile2) C34 agmatinyltransferase TiaS